MSTPRTRRTARGVAALLGASVFLTACGAGGGGDDGEPAAEGVTTGITDSTIKIGTHMPLTGVAAPGYSEIPTGAKAYLARRLIFRAEYNKYVVITDRDDNEEADEWKLGFAFFF